MSNTSLTVNDIIQCLEQVAPPAYQESYDNSGLLTGTPGMKVNNVLVTLDCTEEIVDEAIRKNCEMIVAHHPIVFGGLKKINGKNYVERTVIKAIKNDIAIYAIHTNLDNVHNGVNRKIAEKIGLENLQILAPKSGLLKKLITFVPTDHLDTVKQAMFAAGAGNIGNYDECSFSSEGTGTFRGNDESKPFTGERGTQHHEKETRLEMIVPAVKQQAVVRALLQAHPYEEVAYDIFALDNAFAKVGSGMIGELKTALEPADFLEHLKQSMDLDCIRYTKPLQPVKKVAVCGGAGSFLLKNAISAGADAYVSADFKYHEFFDAENHLMIADIGHYESEIFTKELLADIILKKFPTFAVILSNIRTNPINYL